MRLISYTLSLLLCISITCSATDFIVISEVMYDTPLNEDVSQSPHNYGEFIELCNVGERSADIGGWQLCMPSPQQTYTIPSPCILEPHSFLVIAYGAEYTYSILNLVDIEDYESDFHYMYDISPDSACNIIFQTSLLLPNDNQHSLVLKDANHVTRDSMFYGYTPSWNTLYTQNASVNTIDEVNAFSLCSVKRGGIIMNIDGVTTFNESNWSSCVDPSLFKNSVGCSQYNLHSSIYMPAITVAFNNYVMEITPQEATDAITVTSDTTTINNAVVSINYFDGLGRAEQTVRQRYSPSHKNLVSFTEYDNFGRVAKQWDPVPTELPRLAKSTVSSNASMFYTNESRPYQEYLYSTDELVSGIRSNALTGVQNSGADLNNHHTGILTRANAANEVKLYKVNAAGDLVCSGYYDVKMLLCEQYTDESNKVSCTFKDNQGRTVMQRTGSNYDTYYVYNDLGQLTFVLPPAASDALGQGTYSEHNDVLGKYAYLYRYDNHGRCRYKRMPGCSPVQFFYDKAGRLTCSFDGNQYESEQATITMYDKHSRPLYVFDNEVQGVIYFTDNLADVLDTAQAIADTINGSSNAPQLTDTYYTLPLVQESYGKMLRVVNYYDNYAFLQHSANANVLQYDDTQEGIYGVRTNKTKGLLTGSRTYMLNAANTYIETAYYYDYRGRVIQQRSTNHLGGTNITYTAYSFAGQITKKYETKSTSNTTNPPVRELYDFSYDHAGRLAQILYTYNDDVPIVLSQYAYDELGRLTSRHILNNLDSICYSYNIRNQLTRIKSGTFEENMYYTSQNMSSTFPFTPAYNGNIAMSTWTYGSQVNGYMYYYDSHNRLSSTETILDGIYADLGDFTEQYNYNKQGNITSLYRANDEDYIDVLFMSYNGNRLVSVQNTMSMVPDYQTMHYHDNENATTEFGYDYNGNMVYDKDRGISTIQYNVLNLPDRIQYSNGNQTMHEYDALGNRVRTTYYTRKSLTAVPIGNILHPENNVSDYTVTVDGYNDNVVYYKYNPTSANGYWQEKFVHNPEGLTRHYSYEEHYPFYFIKDHLGNIRETYIKPAPNTKYLIQRMQYYPSGIPWKTSTGAIEHPYRYNGKELVQMHGQDEYDSKARWYHPAICRTTTMDPLCEKYYNISPYAWCGNNPVVNVDINGQYYFDWDDWCYRSSYGNHEVVEWNTIVANHFTEPAPNNEISAKHLVKEFIVGVGPQERNFTEEDNFTQQFIKNNKRLDKEYVKIAKAIYERGIKKSEDDHQNTYGYSLKNSNVPFLIYLTDALNVLSNGLTGNVTKSIIGSYNIQWQLKYFDSEGNAIVEITASNSMTAHSGLRPPCGLGYGTFYTQLISPAIDVIFKDGFLGTGIGAAKSQSMTWTTKIPKK